MKLRAVGFSTNGRGDLKGTLIAMADDGEPLGLEHKGNFSDMRERKQFQRALVAELGIDPDKAGKAVAQALKEIRRACDDSADNSMADEKERLTGNALTKPLADAIILEEGNSFAQDSGRKLYRYSDGVYVRGGEEFIKRRVKALLEAWGLSDQWQQRRADEVVEYVRVDRPILWSEPPKDTINLINGLLYLPTRELRPHSPDFLSLVQLPIIYDPLSTCPAIDEFVRQVFPEDATDLAYELPGVLMVPGEAQDKAVLLIGPGGNGKSTYLAMLRAFLGKRSTVAISLHRLESERFSVARLVGKLANICPDLPSQHLAGTSTFKAITGLDALTGEHKFLDSFDFDCFARLIFSANNPPRSGDSSQGFFDRWIVVLFPNSFRGTEGEIPRKVLDARLAAPSELSGLLNKALDGLARFRANHSRYTISESMRSAFEEFRAVTDPVAVWLDAHTVEGADFVALKSQLLQEYNSAASHNGHQAMTSNAFGRSLRKWRPGLTEAQRTVTGKLQWVYVGIGLQREV